MMCVEGNPEPRQGLRPRSVWFGGWVGHLMPVFGDREGLLGLGTWETFSKNRSIRLRITQAGSLEEAPGYKGCKKCVKR